MKYAGLKHLRAYRWVGVTASVFYEMEFANSLLVVIVFWLLLYLPAPNPEQLDFNAILMHVFNFVFYLVDFSMNDLPVRRFSVVWQLHFPLLYAYFAWIYYSKVGL